MTQNQENVLDLQWLEVDELPMEELDPLSRTMAFHLRKLVDERDDSSEVRPQTLRCSLSLAFSNRSRKKKKQKFEWHDSLAIPSCSQPQQCVSLASKSSENKP